MIGYQIRLESATSKRTILTFCTNGVLLRTLMGGQDVLKTITHIIVDEVHERFVKLFLCFDDIESIIY